MLHLNTCVYLEARWDPLKGTEGTAKSALSHLPSFTNSPVCFKSCVHFGPLTAKKKIERVKGVQRKEQTLARVWSILKGC